MDIGLSRKMFLTSSRISIDKTTNSWSFFDSCVITSKCCRRNKKIYGTYNLPISHRSIQEHLIWKPQQQSFPGISQKTNLPKIIAVRAVVPEDSVDSRAHDSANWASVCINDLATTFSSFRGKSASSTMSLGRLSRTKCAAPFPPCPSKTWVTNLDQATLDKKIIPCKIYLKLKWDRLRRVLPSASRKNSSLENSIFFRLSPLAPSK